MHFYRYTGDQIPPKTTYAKAAPLSRGSLARFQ